LSTTTTNEEGIVRHGSELFYGREMILKERKQDGGKNMEQPTEEQLQKLVKENRMPIYLMVIIIVLLILMRWIFGTNFYAVVI
jgi:hypothetical protein